jgi:hypothetical protein
MFIGTSGTANPKTGRAEHCAPTELRVRLDGGCYNHGGLPGLRIFVLSLPANSVAAIDVIRDPDPMSSPRTFALKTF